MTGHEQRIDQACSARPGDAPQPLGADAVPSVLRQKFCTMQIAARGADFEPGWAVLKIACGVQFQSRERFR